MSDVNRKMYLFHVDPLELWFKGFVQHRPFKIFTRIRLTLNKHLGDFYKCLLDKAIYIQCDFSSETISSVPLDKRFEC